ncbi:hypothetical protein B5E91_05855 [Thomasclavelia spiroformis]|uniref:Uncharacterized protein n=2 Tax=Thomasclavelia spiroformis TaxID=29348 RepID=A0A1Y4QK95_9FIRM|nr:hypothetical protein [Thomasclavelia spiroformis]OUQ05540.1 hypothetical protein B5E91_05855 [Thomasclavelia spiroformis]
MKKKKFIVFIFFSLIIVIIKLSAITSNKVSNIVDYSNVSYLKIYVYNNDKMVKKRLTNDNVSKLEDMLNNLETKKLSTNKANEQKKISGYQVHVASYDQNDKYLFSTTICNEYIIIDDDVYKSSIDQNKKIITYLKQKLNIQKRQ